MCVVHILNKPQNNIGLHLLALNDSCFPSQFVCNDSAGLIYVLISLLYLSYPIYYVGFLRQLEKRHTQRK